ncbi:hypothetical protein BDFB_003227 [Asbolus verrucosus]|uniref:Uncharacterized protein n=1 Tax=Asbolus verrucosus TaxID=1661398 RepID=A0A482VAG4_ASBVE|nr:hypothetical protein BDFB_003227 [Asbolus verrucosus]
MENQVIFQHSSPLTLSTT